MKTLVVTTYAYPFGSGETFFENELPYLCKAFQKVILVSENQNGEQKSIPLNCELRNIKWNNQFPLKKTIIRFGLKSFKHLIYCWWSDNGVYGKPFYAIKKWKIRWLDLLVEHFKGEQLVNQLPELKSANTVLYHYWMIDFARYLSWMKQVGIIHNKQVSRIHGYDFNPQRHPKNHFPFRKAELKGYDVVCAASNFGLKLMQQLHPRQLNKLALNRLGVNIPLQKEAKQDKEENQWCFVSCSNMVTEKRVDWIAQALYEIAANNPSNEFQWHHFGNGDAKDEIITLIETNKLRNLTVTLHGSTPNHDVLNFYESVQVDAIIHASSTEGGCPVAIQEAFAYGIPMVGLANEGAEELALHDTIQTNCHKQEQLAILIQKFINLPVNEVLIMKLEVYDFAKSNFSSNKNYTEFITGVLLK